MYKVYLLPVLTALLQMIINTEVYDTLKIVARVLWEIIVEIYPRVNVAWCSESAQDFVSHTETIR